MISKLKEIIFSIYTWLSRYLKDRDTLKPIFSKDYAFGNLSLVEYGFPGIVDWSSTLVTRQQRSTNSYVKRLPGVWVFTPKEGDYQYVIILLNIAAYKSTKNMRTDAPTAWTSVFESKINQHIDKAHRATHLFVDLWVSKEKISFKKVKNKLEPTYKVLNKNALLLDLQGYKEFAPAGDTFAKKIFNDYINQLLNIKCKAGFLTWEKIVQQIDSRQWIDLLAKQYFGEDHVTLRN